MIELEKKLLLTEDEYYYLMEHLGCESHLNQKPITTLINYYFDTDDFTMNCKNTTCRIRLKDGRYKATMKKHSSAGDQSEETEMKIHGGLESNAFTDMGLKLQGELVTKRCVVFKDFNCEAVLDKNEYLGYTDFELEIEYALDHEEDARTIMRIIRNMLTCRKCFLAYKESLVDLPNVPSKSNRFFEKKSVTRNTEKRDVSDSNQKDTSSYDFLDPDDYLRSYFDYILPRESVCKSCIHFDGSSCHSPAGACDKN